MNRLNQLGARAKQLLAGFTPGQRGVIIVGVALLILGTVVLGRWAAQPSWSPLYANLSGTDASAIIDQLKSQNVSYELTDGGNTIMVPASQVYNLRVALSAKGLPAGTSSNDSSSWSVLDSQGMTATDFQQNVAYQRALQSELDKTLEAIGGVNTAIVHLAIPQADVFSTTTPSTTASVLLSLSPDVTLTRSQIRAVMHLVAGSVPGLKPTDVTITDQNGDMLSVPGDATSDAAGSASDTDEQTQAFEDAKTAVLQKMLDSVLGAGKSVVRVNAELDYDASTTTSQSYVSQSGISPLSVATDSESYNAVGGATGGALGQAYPSLTPGSSYGSSGGAYVHVQGTVDYPVGTVLTDTTAAPGSVKRMTVAVVLDSKAAAAIPAAQLAQLNQLVANAVGLNTARGDSVQISQMPFDTTAATAAAKELKAQQAAAQTAQYIGLGEKAGIVVAAVVVGMIMMRRRRRNAPPAPALEAVASDLPSANSPAMLSTLEEQLAISAGARELMDEEDPSAEREVLRDEVAKFVEQQPEEIALIVQSWLGQRKS